MLVFTGFCLTHLLYYSVYGGLWLLNTTVVNQFPLSCISELRTSYGVSRSRYPGYRGGGAHPGVHSNAPTSWHGHGPRCPDNGPLGETGSSASASPSTTGVSPTRPSSSWSQWDLSLPAPGTRGEGCELPVVPSTTGPIPGHRPPGYVGP